MRDEYRGEAFYFGLSFFFLAFCFFGGHVYSADGQAYLSVALNLVLAQPPTVPTGLEGFGVHGVDGLYYSKFGLGYSLVLVPFVVVAILVAGLFGQVLTGPVLEASVLLSGPVLGGLGVYLFDRLQVKLDVPDSPRRAATVFFALGGLWLVYARMLFSELAVGVALLVLLLAQFSEEEGRSWLVGFAAALMVLMRLETIVLVGPLLLAHVVRTGKWIPTATPPVLAAGLIGYYNWMRFGNPVTAGMGSSPAEAFSTPLLKGLAGQFVAPGNGLFVYAPYLGVCLVVSLLLVIRRRPTHTTTWGALLVGVAAYLLVHSTWHSWMGGWSWGPRRLVPLLGPLHLLVAVTWWHGSIGLKRLLLILLCFSIVINVGGLLGDYADYYEGAFYVRDVLFHPGQSQVWNQTLGLLRGEYPLDSFWVRLAGSVPGTVVLGGWLLVALFCLVRALKTKPGSSDATRGKGGS